MANGTSKRSVKTEYAIEIHVAEEGGYWASVVDLPGCVSQGETLDEVNANILDALQECLDAEVDKVDWKVLARIR